MEIPPQVCSGHFHGKVVNETTLDCLIKTPSPRGQNFPYLGGGVLTSDLPGLPQVSFDHMMFKNPSQFFQKKYPLFSRNGFFFYLNGYQKDRVFVISDCVNKVLRLIYNRIYTLVPIRFDNTLF